MKTNLGRASEVHDRKVNKEVINGNTNKIRQGIQGALHQHQRRLPKTVFKNPRRDLVGSKLTLWQVSQDDQALGTLTTYCYS